MGDGKLQFLVLTHPRPPAPARVFLKVEGGLERLWAAPKAESTGSAGASWKVGAADAWALQHHFVLRRVFIL